MFSGENYKDILAKNKECIVRYPDDTWGTKSSEVKDLLSKLLTKSGEDRLTAQEAQSHPWFAKMLQDPSFTHD